MNPLSLFHPAVAEWFAHSFAAPTAAQAEAWPAIRSGKNVLIAAPTGSGKTLAAFLAAIDGLARQGLAGDLADATQIVYVSPLKALSNDIEKNLEAPLAGIRENLMARGLPEVEIRRWVRTGDTPAGERERMRRTPPHILVTTPESLYILLGSASGRAMLATTRTVIIDEIHAVASNKRGAHLALSLARLDALCGKPPLRIGLSATQKPIELVARFLVGPEAPCHVIDTGHSRPRDLALELPGAPLEAVMSAETWKEVYDRLAERIAAHRTTLVFVNTRRMAERAARHLTERLGADRVTAHHGSLAREQRLESERRLKSGSLKALVATASLELGIDIGEVDLVCQLGSPHAIASLLQRIGRSGHAVGGVSKGRLFPLSRDDLVECAALLDSVAKGELDRLTVPEQPLDVLAQQIVAEVAARDWDEDGLYALVRRAWPYRALPRADFAEIVRMLADGFSTRRGRRGALVHHDAVNRVLRGRRGARLLALTSGGTIPDTADYQVLLEPDNLTIGTVNEDFAVESLPGDIFQLGNRSYRILKTERGILRVADAEGMPPTIPFWLGEASGRSDEVSAAVSRLRAEIAESLAADPSGRGAQRRLVEEAGIGADAAAQLIDYLAAAHAALGLLPTQQTLVFERFFDAAGGMQLVIHSPYGSRINRAWGLALRKRFCRKFNFELQAAATEDNIILSLTTAHSFPLLEVKDYLKAKSFRPVLTQALLAAPMFTTRWRWVAAVALALPRFRGGRKVPPQLARMEAEDLIAAVFPDQLACGDNIVGEREIPDHPLVRQTIADCLGAAMDADGLEHLLTRLETGEVAVVARDLAEPSPLACEILAARPWAYLDDAPLEERRTQAVMARRWLSPEEASEIGRLDAQAIARVRAEAWPEAANPDELHDALSWLGFLGEAEVAAAPSEWRHWLFLLARDKRAAQLDLPPLPVASARQPSPPDGGRGKGEGGAADARGRGPHPLIPKRESEKKIWIAAERLPQFRALWPRARFFPVIAAPEAARQHGLSAEEALVEILRGRLEGLGPVGATALAAPLGLRPQQIAAPLAALEGEGFALRGHFTCATGEEEWCERRLLARIHRYTVKRLRAEIEPVAARDFLRFLFEWQRVGPEARMAGPDAVAAITGQLEGFEAPAGAWETEILPARIAGYDPAWLDDHCLSGRLAWVRLRPRTPRGPGEDRRVAPVRATPIALLPRRHAALWAALQPRAISDRAGTPASPNPETPAPSPRARMVADHIRTCGASFFDELVEGTGLLRPQVEDALAELVALGLVASDSFAGLRALLLPAERRRNGGRRRGGVLFGMEDAGRWALARRPGPREAAAQAASEAVEHLARVLLRRYGVVFWRLVERESARLPPWRDLLRVYRRLEARGEVRGGRFVAGFSGEQFAAPEAIPLLRAARKRPQAAALVSVSGADPLNLVGILFPAPRLAAVTGNRVLYRDGVPLALYSGGVAQFLERLDPAEEWQAKKLLLRSPVPAGLAVLA